MAKRKDNPDHPEPLDEQVMQVLMKEYDALIELYTHAETSAQNLFNFYVTLVSTVVGGLVVVSQFGAGGASRLLVLSLLLYFAAAVGSAYLSALTGRYPHMARFARGIDSLRRMLIEQTDVTRKAACLPSSRGGRPERGLSVIARSKPSSAKRWRVRATVEALIPNPSCLRPPSAESVPD